MNAPALPATLPPARLVPHDAEAEARRLLLQVRRLCYDDALTFGSYRLEYLYLCAGFVHYRLYWRGRVIYRQDVRSRRVLDAAQRRVADELAAQGWRADDTRLAEFGALTPMVRARAVRRQACNVARRWWRGVERARQPVQLVLL